MKNGLVGLLVGWGEPIYVKLKEVKKLAVRHFKEHVERAWGGYTIGSILTLFVRKM